MSEHKKPTGPTAPDGYRWVPLGQMLWPTDKFWDVANDCEYTATDWGREYQPAPHQFTWYRPKVTQPDLVWLKSKATKQAESLTGIEREKVRWQIAQAVQLYAETLMSLIPEPERYRPDQKGGDE